MGVLRIRGDQTVAWPHLPFPERVGRVAPEYRSEEAVGYAAVSGSAGDISEEERDHIASSPRPERASSETTSGAGPSSARSVDAAPEESFLRRAEGPDEELL